MEPPKQRRSVGAECNWGIRFRDQAEAEDFLNGLAGELCTRLTSAGKLLASVQYADELRHLSNVPLALLYYCLQQIAAPLQGTKVCCHWSLLPVLPIICLFPSVNRIAWVSIVLHHHVCLRSAVRSSIAGLLRLYAVGLNSRTGCDSTHRLYIENFRMQAGVQGRTITLKLKRRKENAPEPPKFMGHGICDNMSRSVTVGRSTASQEDVVGEARQMLRALHVNPTQIRGIGLNVSPFLWPASSPKWVVVKCAWRVCQSSSAFGKLETTSCQLQPPSKEGLLAAARISRMCIYFGQGVK